MAEVTHGHFVEAFEHLLKLKTKAKYAIAVSSGTAALHLALRTAGVGPGDHVVVPAFTFVATANSAMYCGAVPNFVDCDEYGGLDPQKLDDWLLQHSVRAVVCVHVFGNCCDMDGLLAVCQKHNVPLIEDAAQAIGSYYQARHTGTFGLLGTFSFNGNKVITTGGGGAVVTDSEELAKRVRHLANVAKEDVPHEFWHAEIGYNYRMPNINAALGCGQMDNLYSILGRKRILAKKYREIFQYCPYARMMEARPEATSNHWLNAIVLDGLDRKETCRLLCEAGFESRLCWTPLHLLSMYKDAPRDDLSMTMKLASSIVNVPSGPGIIE